MAEHCTQLWLPAREDYIFVAKALNQVSKSTNNYQILIKSACYYTSLQVHPQARTQKLGED